MSSETLKKIEVTAPGAAEIFARWLARGDKVGVFTNMALDSAGLGHQVFLPLNSEDATPSKLHKLHAPDGPHGTGWKYLLTSFESSLDAFTFTE